MEEIKSLREKVLSRFGEYLKAEAEFYEKADFSPTTFSKVNAAKWNWQEAEKEYYSELLRITQKKH